MLEVYSVERIKTQILLKRNLKALLRHRDISQAAFARHLLGRDAKHADAWISHILNEYELDRELPMELWDKAAAKLGVDTYHFFLPGVANSLTERRSGSDRRKGAERRIGYDLPARPRELDLMNLFRVLPPKELEEAIEAVLKLVDQALRRRRATLESSGGPGGTGENAEASRALKRGRKVK